MAGMKAIQPPDSKDETLFLRMLFLRTERQLVDEITTEPDYEAALAVLKA